MTTVGYVNVSLQIWGCVICVIVRICIAVSRRPEDSCSRKYLRMLLFNTGALLFDAAAFFLRGNEGVLFWWGVRAANLAAFSCNYLLMAEFVEYMTEYIGRRCAVWQLPARIARALCAMFLALLVVNLFWPVLYEIDAQNMYHRLPLFWLSQLPGVIVIGMVMLMLIHSRRELEPPERIALWSYAVLPMIAVTVQMFVYGLALLSLANTVALTLVFLFLQAEQGRRMAEQGRLMAEQEAELAQSRISIMLSQIQPHFLYNALNSIRYLCKTDPVAAQETIDDFSAYLRGNMDSLNRKAPVPLEKELEHVRIYLSLEKMRFEEDLNVVWDIRTTAFMLPALTVQPLVENAVKYGLGKKPGGGTVTISTRETEDSYEITVADDGVGYDPQEVQYDGRTQLGVDNVRCRLEAMSSASLRIESRPGEGTTAIISIPKEDTAA